MIAHLAKLSDTELALAIMYAEYYLKTGDDITREYKTAVEKMYELHERELCAFSDVIGADTLICPWCGRKLNVKERGVERAYSADKEGMV